ncbi:MAG: hypothetical protein LBU43_06510 [Candidatus Accumulibacter sp.]|jgi:hypothetical protein|nr:hypothetical protein [Accumulibacter sp.]
MSRNYHWVYDPKPRKNALNAPQKAAALTRAEDFVENHLRRNCIQAPPGHGTFPVNYVVDFSVKWHGAYLVFIAKYASPYPDAEEPFFETRFARLGCSAPDRFSLWVLRHNDKWMELPRVNGTLQECLEDMRTSSWF